MREGRGIANYSTKGRKDIEHEEKDKVNNDDSSSSSIRNNILNVLVI